MAAKTPLLHRPTK
jgi:hypothetical protein